MTVDYLIYLSILLKNWNLLGLWIFFFRKKFLLIYWILCLYHLLLFFSVRKKRFFLVLNWIYQGCSQDWIGFISNWVTESECKIRQIFSFYSTVFLLMTVLFFIKGKFWPVLICRTNYTWRHTLRLSKRSLKKGRILRSQSKVISEHSWEKTVKLR